MNLKISASSVCPISPPPSPSPSPSFYTGPAVLNFASEDPDVVMSIVIEKFNAILNVLSPVKIVQITKIINEPSMKKVETYSKKLITN